MTQSYNRILTGSSLSSLQKLVGLNVNSIYSSALSVFKEHIESQLFIFPLGSGWLNITNKAEETTNDNDYYELRVSFTQTPQDLTYNKELGSIKYPFSKVDINQTTIATIEIFARKEKYDDEELFYDVAMLFTCKDNFRFMIGVEERVDEFLFYSTNKAIIDEYTTGLLSRLIIH